MERVIPGIGRFWEEGSMDVDAIVSWQCTSFRSSFHLAKCSVILAQAYSRVDINP
jgi:hypothetical protein